MCSQTYIDASLAGEILQADTAELESNLPALTIIIHLRHHDIYDTESSSARNHASSELDELQ